MANENKCPSIIVYSRQNGDMTSWGFASENRLEQNNPDREYIDWFKVYLDESLLQNLRQRDPHNMPSSIELVEKWFTDYLAQLYQHIEYMLSQELPRETGWSTALVEFIFSVPTTWSTHTVERFRSCLAKAGYSKYHNHSIAVGLTEAEAAAVLSSVEATGLFREGENVLVCDVGGGTTDLSVLTVESIDHGPRTLKQLDVVIGRNIGSVKIDEAFENLVRKRLQAADQAMAIGIDVDDAAWLMMKSREYQNAKCEHGSRDETPFFYVPIPNIPQGYINEPFGVNQGALRVSQGDLRGLFDTQVNRLYELIDQQLDLFQKACPGQSLSHLILSGGLGNSTYIQSRLHAKYGDGGSSFLSARHMQIHLAPDPQLAVAKGIVHDRVRKLNSGRGVLGWRCARASYGALCKILYNASNPTHANLRTSVDPFDGKLYVTQAIEWFIRKARSQPQVSTPCSKTEY
jgi:hypothetical protein